MIEGRAGDKRGRWAVEDVLEVRRPGGKGRKLEAKVAWVGDGEWDDEWVQVTQLTGDLRKRAREMEVTLTARRRGRATERRGHRGLLGERL